MNHLLLRMLLLALFFPLPALAETWVALGDSITYRTAHAPEAGAWHQIVAAKTGHTVINAGVDGDTAVGTYRRLQSDVLAHKPDHVLVMLGINDHWVPQGQHGNAARYTPNQFGNALLNIVDVLQTRGIRVTLMTNRPIYLGGGPSRNTYMLQVGAEAPSPKGTHCFKMLCIYNDVIRQISTMRGTGLVDVWEAVAKAGYNNDRDDSIKRAAIGIPGSGFDGVHLGPKGHELVADAVLKALGNDE